MEPVIELNDLSVANVYIVYSVGSERHRPGTFE